MIKWKVILKTSHRNLDRVENCITTWLDGLDYVCLTDRLTGKYNEISGSNDDSYESNEQKTVTLINLIRETELFSDYDWLVFIDDDAILNVKMFKKVIGQLDRKNVYGLILSGFDKAPGLRYPSGGSGYFISPSVIKRKGPMINRGWGFEDASIGKWIEENNINLVEMPKGIKLNGWFPFEKHWKNLITGGNGYANRMVQSLSGEDDDFLQSHLTHHYIRWKPFMKYIHDVNEKSPY